MPEILAGQHHIPDFQGSRFHQYGGNVPPATIQGRLEVSKTAAEAYVADRLPHMISELSSARRWAIAYDGAELSGTVVAGDMFIAVREAPTARLKRLLDLVAAQLIAHPDARAEIEISSADLSMVADNEISLDLDSARKVMRLIDALDDHDDVDAVYSNSDIPDEVVAELSKG